MTGPIRTCVACRRRRPAGDLVRIRRDGDTLAVGPGPGRGVWVGPAIACLDRAIARKAIARGLRAEVNGDAVARIRDSWPTEPAACPYEGAG